MPARHIPHFVIVAALAFGSVAFGDGKSKKPPKFTAGQLAFFEKKVQPLLKARCFKCHSSKLKEPKGGLTLDSRAGVLKGGESGPAAVPGDVKKSRVIAAVNYETFEMPPRSKLPAGEIAILTKWVKLGIPFSKSTGKPAVVQSSKFPLEARKRNHWAWRPIRKPALPKVRDKEWAATPIDRFILAKLEAKGLAPAPRADRRTLIRRASFDLIGLPPTPKEIAEFLNDPAPTRTAFARVVDRLLKSPHFGERWARHWLDLVRYADTLGHEFDYPLRHAHRYRDYVIRAFNADVPYDQFVKEHIVGDLIDPRRPRTDAPPRTHTARRHPKLGYNESIIGTGFWFLGEDKHAPVDVKGEEASKIDNQIDVFSKTFLGLTVACARCHDHKFDAISTQDYYALAGFLQSSRRHTALLDPRGVIHKKTAELRKLKQAGEKLLSKSAAAATRTTVVQVRREDAATKPFADFNGKTFGQWLPTGFAFGEKPTQPGEWDLHEDKPRFLEPGVANSRRYADKLGGVLRSPTFTITHDQILYRVKGKNARIRLIIDGYRMDEFSGLLFKGCLQKVDTGGEWKWLRQAGDVHRYKGHRAHIELIDDGDGWLAVDEIRFANNGDPTPERSTALRGQRNRSPRTPAKPVKHIAANARNTKSREAATAIRLGRQPQEFGPIEARKPRRGDSTNAAPSGLRPLSAHANLELPPQANRFRPSGTSRNRDSSLERLLKRIKSIQQTIPDPMPVLAMTDGSGEDEHVFIRGSHKNLGPKVHRRMLEAVAGEKQPPIKTGSGRLELANRLLDPSNPFPARVMVNRLWHYLTGRGIVASVDNFGVLGQRPTHPELLDYLASEFRRDNWSIKRAIRRIVLSSTYMMSSNPAGRRALAQKVDPQNLLLHRMRVRRLQGEAIRDAMLAVSGRLDRKMFGPPVPIHLTRFMQGRGRPKQSGPLDGNGRRSIYIIVRRNFLSPMMLAFDTPIPFTAIGRRNVSNVPAQALILLNDPFVVQQAGLWAKRVLADRSATPEHRITAMYETAFAREPNADELKDALAFLQMQAKSLGLKGDAWKSHQALWRDLAHVLFNVKEFIYLR